MKRRVPADSSTASRRGVAFWTRVEERKAEKVLEREKFQLKSHGGGKTNAEKRRRALAHKVILGPRGVAFAVARDQIGLEYDVDGTLAPKARH